MGGRGTVKLLPSKPSLAKLHDSDPNLLRVARLNMGNSALGATILIVDQGT
jgi:hypothetical protein